MILATLSHPCASPVPPSGLHMRWLAVTRSSQQTPSPSFVSPALRINAGTARQILHPRAPDPPAARQSNRSRGRQTAVDKRRRGRTRQAPRPQGPRLEGTRPGRKRTFMSCPPRRSKTHTTDRSTDRPKRTDRSTRPAARRGTHARNSRPTSSRMYTCRRRTQTDVGFGSPSPAP